MTGMYYFLEATSGKNHENVILSGTIYGKKKEVVGKIFNPGVSLKEKHGEEHFTIVVDEKESSLTTWVDVVCGFVKRAGNIFIASDKACALFQELGLDNLEYYGLTISLKKKEIKNYKIINVVGKIDCIDTEKSKIEYYDNGNVEYVEKLVLDTTKIPKGMKIFLLGKHNSAEIFVHESVQEAIENNLQGFLLTTDSKYVVR